MIGSQWFYDYKVKLPFYTLPSSLDYRSTVKISLLSICKIKILQSNTLYLLRVTYYIKYFKLNVYCLLMLTAFLYFLTLLIF